VHPAALRQVISTLPRPLEEIAHGKRISALAWTPGLGPAVWPDGACTRADRGGWCTWRATRLRRAARNARSPWLHDAVVAPGASVVWSGKGVRKSTARVFSEVAVQTGPQTVQNGLRGTTVGWYIVPDLPAGRA